MEMYETGLGLRCSGMRILEFNYPMIIYFKIELNSVSV